MVRGRFIVIEGLDGCGKTTQGKLLTETLQARGIPAVFTAEPTTSETGKLIRRILSGEVQSDPATTAALFAADRIRHNLRAQDGICAQIEKGCTVVCDRYYYSSMAYQGMDADPDWVRHINIDCPYIQKPDLCIFLEADTDVCLSRIHAGRDASQIEIFENKASLNRIRARFNEVFRSLPHDAVVRINAEAAIEEIAEQITAHIQALFPNNKI